MIIGIDLDCVLNNMDEVWINRYNGDYSDNLTISDLHVWGIDKVVKKECGIKIYDYFNEPGFFRSLRPQPNAVDVLKWITEQSSNEVYIVTASDPHVMQDKMDWIHDHFPFFDLDRVVMMKHKWHMNLDVLIDDGLHNFGRNHKYWLIYNKAHNQKYQVCNKTKFRVHNWDDIKQFFQGIGPF